VIGALLKQVAAREPDTVAFVDGDRRLTYAEWDWLSDRAAFSLWEEGIRPGETFTYRFTVRQAGTYWYHSHSGGQEQEGLYAPIVIEPAKGAFSRFERAPVDKWMSLAEGHRPAGCLSQRFGQRRVAGCGGRRVGTRSASTFVPSATAGGGRRTSPSTVDSRSVINERCWRFSQR